MEHIASSSSFAPYGVPKRPTAIRTRPLATEQLGGDGRVAGSPEFIHSLPAPIRDAVVASANDAVQVAFLAGAPVAMLAFLVAWTLKERPVREPARAEPTAALAE